MCMYVCNKGEKTAFEYFDNRIWFVSKMEVLQYNGISWEANDDPSFR